MLIPEHPIGGYHVADDILLVMSLLKTTFTVAFNMARAKQSPEYHLRLPFPLFPWNPPLPGKKLTRDTSTSSG
jgi:hypothetical protein